MHAKDASGPFEWRQRWAADPRWVRALLPAAILIATFLAYVSTLALGFVFDDHILIVGNDSIRSWRYFPGYFASHIWSFRYPHLLSNAYRPFLLIWLRLNDLLFGQRAWGWHLLLVVLHVAVTYLVYRLSLRLTCDPWSAGAAALIFGLHPVHVETIAEAAWADQPLSTFFILAAILSFCRSREQAPGFRWLRASYALTAAALLSKESGLVLPMLIGGFVWIYGAPIGREAECHFFPRLRSALGASVPYWAVVLAYLLMRIGALKGFAHAVTPLALSTEVFTIPSVLLFYLRLLVWPSGLSCYYDTPYVSTPSWQGFVLPLLLLAAVAVALALWYVRIRRTAPEQARTIAFACLWMILTLIPVLNFRLLPEGEIAHDRYVYLPSVGFVLLVAMILRPAKRVAAKSPAWALAGALALFGAMGCVTARQCLFWSDDLTLNYRAHQIAPHNVSATTSLAAAVARQGMDRTAIALYQQALAIQPGFWQANVNLGYLYYAHGDFPEAARHFSRATAANPADGDQFLYLGMAMLRMGRTSEAESAVRMALLARPEGKNCHLGLAMVLQREGNFQAAMQEVKAELADDPQNAQARRLLDVLTRQIQFSSGEPSAAPSPEPLK